MVMTRWLRHMKTAVSLARGSIRDKRSTYFGAVVADKKIVIGSSVNIHNAHPRLKWIYPDYCGIHAEAGAIINASRARGDLRDMDLFVMRVHRSCEIHPNSKPCDNCTSLMVHFGIRRVIYLTEARISSITLRGNGYYHDWGPMEILKEKWENL